MLWARQQKTELLFAAGGPQQKLPLKTPSPGKVNRLQTYSPCYPKKVEKLCFEEVSKHMPTTVKDFKVLSTELDLCTGNFTGAALGE